MRERIEPQECRHLVPIPRQELAGIAGAGIGDGESDVEVVCDGGELLDKTLLGEIGGDDAMLDAEILGELGPRLLEQGLPPGYEHDIDARCRDLAGELPADTR